MPRLRHPLTIRPAVLVAALGGALLLAGCPAKDEKGLDFAKSQREALDKAKGVEKTMDDASRKALDAADKRN